MNFLQLCQRAREKCGISGSGPLSTVSQAGEALRIVNWVNESWMEIQNQQPDWKWMQAAFSFPTVNAKQDYTPAEIGVTNFSHWRDQTFRVYRTAEGLNDEQYLRPYEFESFRDVYQYAYRIPGRPNFFAVRPEDYALLLGPIPDQAFTVVGRYQKVATELSGNTDTPGMPSKYHMLIVYGAMERYAAYEAAPEVMMGVQREYGEMRSKLEIHQLEMPYIGGTLA